LLEACIYSNDGDSKANISDAHDISIIIFLKEFAL
jgi:hypothetical protein